MPAVILTGVERDGQIFRGLCIQVQVAQQNLHASRVGRIAGDCHLRGQLDRCESGRKKNRKHVVRHRGQAPSIIPRVRLFGFSRCVSDHDRPALVFRVA